MFCAGFLSLRGRGGKSFLPLSWGVNDVGEKFTSVRSNIAGFTEKRVGAQLAMPERAQIKKEQETALLMRI